MMMEVNDTRLRYSLKSVNCLSKKNDDDYVTLMLLQQKEEQYLTKSLRQENKGFVGSGDRGQ